MQTLLRDRFRIDVQTTEKNQRTKHNILLYSFMEKPQFLRQVLGLENGYNLKDGKALNRPWTTEEAKTALNKERKRMQKLCSAAGFEKRDEQGFNYWEAQLKKWITDEDLSGELSNAEILTSLKELNLPAFVDKVVFATMSRSTEELKSQGLSMTKKDLEPWMVSVKVLWLATEYALDFLEEQKAVAVVENRQPGQGGKWLKGEWAKTFKGKPLLWEFVLELIEGPYDKLDEHPFIWLAKSPGMNIRTAMNDDVLQGRKASCLEGVWKRLLVM